MRSRGATLSITSNLEREVGSAGSDNQPRAYSGAAAKGGQHLEDRALARPPVRKVFQRHLPSHWHPLGGALQVLPGGAGEVPSYMPPLH